MTSTIPYGLAIARWNSNGTLDTSFDSDGWKSVSLATNDTASAACLQQSDGKVLLGGATEVGGSDDSLMMRMNSNGSLDTTWDGDGYNVSPLGFGGETIQQVRVLADYQVGVKPHFRAHGRQRIERGHRRLELVADAADVDDQRRGVLLHQLAAQEADHRAPPGRPSAR